MNILENVAADVETDPIGYQMTRNDDAKVDAARGYTNFELIYTGSSGGTLHITYREFSPDDLARTAFFQDLSYAATQKVIRFRNIEIQVIDATNEHISYKVTEFSEDSGMPVAGVHP
jgi:hypothetical protein